MCGISVIYHLQQGPVDRQAAAELAEKLRHRGPDQSGFWAADGIALSHRRLSIIDLSENGANPMPNEDESLRLVANGEIYNFRELRAGLLERGHRFRSQTDTEVLLHLYEEKGTACVHDLNGMFAFAIWDSRARRLFLARDRFGVKPLYYTRQGSLFSFASEIKAFLALRDFRARLDLKALDEHLSFQNTLSDRTFFEGVKMLPPGSFLVAENGGVQIQKYWDYAPQPDETLSFDACSERLAELFEQSVRRQMVSDVPVGSYLSGGMDTGAITAVAGRILQPLHTFTCGFAVRSGMSEEELSFDESAQAREMAQLFGTRHHAITLDAQAMAPVFPAVVWHLDEPRVGISYQVYLIAEVISRHVKVVLSGVGGDELFAGYPWRYESLVSQHGEAFLRAHYAQVARLLTDEEKAGLWTGAIRARLRGHSTFDVFQKTHQSIRCENPLDRLLAFDFKTFLHGLLVVDDKLSMAHSVEARVPFLDNALVDFAVRIPSGFKLREGQGKAVLRKAMQPLLPPGAAGRRKQGFTPPDGSWYKNENRAAVEELVLGERAKGRGLFEPKALRVILDDHMAGRRNHRFLIWSLMSLEWWQRIFIDQEPFSVNALAGQTPRENLR